MSDNDHIRSIVTSTARDYDMEYDEVLEVFNLTCHDNHLTNEFYDALEEKLKERQRVDC